MPRVSSDPGLAARLAAITLPAADGSTVALGELWAERSVVLAHLRHFG